MVDKQTCKSWLLNKLRMDSNKSANKSLCDSNLFNKGSIVRQSNYIRE